MPLQAPDEPKKYTTVYGDFRGVDFTNDPTSVWKRRSPTGLNMTPDMGGKPWKRTGWNIEIAPEDFKTAYKTHMEEEWTGKVEILNIYSFELAGYDHLFIFTTLGVFTYREGELFHLLYYPLVTNNSNRGFFYEGGATAGFYFYGDYKLFRYSYLDDTIAPGFVLDEIEPYVPLVLIGRSHNGGGTAYEAENLLSSKRRESFYGAHSSTGTALDYYLSATAKPSTIDVEIKNSDGEWVFVINTEIKRYTDRVTIPNSLVDADSNDDQIRITYTRSLFSGEVTDSMSAAAMWAPSLGGTTDREDQSFTLPAIPVYDSAQGKFLVSVYQEVGGVSTPLDSALWEVTVTGDVASVVIKFSMDAFSETTSFSGTISYTYIADGAKSPAATAWFNTKTNAIYGTGLASAVFVAGCSDANYTSRVWYSQTNDPTYFPDLNYFEAGSDDTKIMGLMKVGEYLGVIKQGDAMDSTIYLAYPVSFDDDTAYAVKQSVNGIGALSRKCFDILGDETLFLSKEGIMAIEPSETETERQTKNRSYYINRKLLSESNLSEAVSFVWNGLYILCVNSHCYVLDGAQKSSWANEKTNLQYEGYYWENIPAVCFGKYNDDLWFADSSGNLCRLKTYEKDGMAAYSDNGKAIPCEWSTVLDNDGATNFFKNLQKKGCLVSILPMEKTGAKVFVRADDKEPVEIGEIASENVEIPQEFYLNKKVKKYKRLQIIVKNEAVNEGLGIQEIVKIYTMGNYSKNRSVNNGT